MDADLGEVIGTQDTVAPVVVGSGRRLFEDGTPHALALVAIAGSPTGSLMAHYRVIHERDLGPALRGVSALTATRPPVAR